MAEIKSRSRRKTKDTSEEAVTQKDNTPAPVATETKHKDHNMTEASSILEFSEDISSAEPPVPMPDGDYTAEIRAVARKTSPTSGNDYLQVSFFINPDEYPADYTDGNPDGTLLTFNRVSMADTVPGRYRLRKFIEAIGAKGGKQIDINDWIGMTATIRVGTSEYEGEKRNEVKAVVGS